MCSCSLTGWCACSQSKACCSRVLATYAQYCSLASVACEMLWSASCVLETCLECSLCSCLECS